MKTLPIALVALGLITLLPAVGGCRSTARRFSERAAEKAIEEQTGAKEVSLDKGGVRIEGKDGERVQMGAAAKLPDGWPDYLPAYPGGKILMAIAGQGPTGKTVTMESADPVDKITEFYKEKFTDGGWKVQLSANMGGVQHASFTKGSSTGSVTASAAGSKTMITVVVVET